MSRPELKWVPVDRMVVDDTYQRPIRKEGAHNVKRIASNFDWHLVGALTLSPLLPEQVKRLKATGGHFAVLDGQHRWAGAKERGDIAELPALIVPTTTVGEQAALFLSLNRDRVAVQPIQQFWAAVAAGDPISKRVTAACARAGVTISRVQSGSHPPLITSAVGVIKRALSDIGDEKVVIALQALADAYRTVESGFSGPMMSAAFALVAAGASKASLAAALRRYEPKALLIRARVERHESGAKGSIGTALQTVIAKAIEAPPRAVSAPAPAPAAPKAAKPAAPVARKPLPAGEPKTRKEAIESVDQFLARGGRIQKVDITRPDSSGGVPAHPTRTKHFG